MIPVREAAAPDDFDRLVRTKGLNALREMVTDEADRLAIAKMLGEEPSVIEKDGVERKRRGRPRLAAGKYKQCGDIPTEKFPQSWTKVLEYLWKSYDGVCNFCCLYIEEGTGDRTVDHMIARRRNWRLAYEWSNFRLACRVMNSNKGDSTAVLDPFLVEDGWFALELAGFQVVPGPKAMGAVRERVERTIEFLKLNREGRIGRQMERYWDDYWAEKPIPFRYLKARAPFLASEMLRQGKVRPEDAGA